MQTDVSTFLCECLFGAGKDKFVTLAGSVRLSVTVCSVYDRTLLLYARFDWLYQNRCPCTWNECMNVNVKPGRTIMRPKKYKIYISPFWFVIFLKREHSRSALQGRCAAGDNKYNLA